MKTNIMMTSVMKDSGIERLMVKSHFLKSAEVRSSMVRGTLLVTAVVKGAMLDKTVKNTMVKIAMVLGAMVMMASCGKTEKPEIVSFELGYENSKTAYAGGELHMDAEVVAEGTIDVIRIEIHPEGGHDKKGIRPEIYEGDWEVDTTYTRFSGLKNTTFHEDIEIPADADPGDYHFYFEVIDMEGYQTVYEEELELLAPQIK